MEADNYYGLETGGEFQSHSTFWRIGNFIDPNNSCIHFCDKCIQVDELQPIDHGCAFRSDIVLSKLDFQEFSLRNPMISFGWHFCNSIEESIDKSDKAFGFLLLKNGRILYSIESSYSCCNNSEKNLLINGWNKPILNSWHLSDRLKSIYPGNKHIK
jgi:hypothetical protein